MYSIWTRGNRDSE